MKRVRKFTLALAAVVFCTAGQLTVASAGELVERYTGILNQLRAELTAEVPEIDLEKAKTAGSPEERRLKKFLASDALDAKLGTRNGDGSSFDKADRKQLDLSRMALPLAA